MQLTAENLNYILAIIALMSIAFGVWSKISKPQTELEKKQALDNEEVESKSLILAKELEIRNEEYNRRFNELAENNRLATAMAQNHIHSVKVQIENLTTLINCLNIDFRSSFTKLETIINERVPASK